MKESEKLSQKIADVTAKIEALRVEYKSELERAADSLDTKNLSRIAAEQNNLENVFAILEKRHAEAVASEAAANREETARKAEKEAAKYVALARKKFQEATAAARAYLEAIKVLETIREEYKTSTADCGIDYYSDLTNQYFSVKGLLAGDIESLIKKVDELIAYGEREDLPARTYRATLANLEAKAGVS
jgi:hypothetical protein